MLDWTDYTDRRPDYLSLFPTDDSLERFEKAQVRRCAQLKCMSSPPENREQSFLGGHPPESLQPVPSAQGRIDKILLTVPPSNADPDKIYPTIARHFEVLVDRLGTDRDYVVLCHDVYRDQVESWFKNPVRQPQIISSVFAYSMWAQDAYTVLFDDTTSYLCEPVLFLRDEDMSVAKDVASQTEVKRLQSSLYYQGGNILRTNRHVLIGEDYIRRNVARAGLSSREAVIERFEQMFGVDVLTLGEAEKLPLYGRKSTLSGLYQPLFHIDMYVTPTGIIDSDGKEVIIIGTPAKAKEALVQTFPTTESGSAPAGWLSFNHYFESAIETLESNGYKVFELPLLPEYSSLGHEDLSPNFYHLTYNNVVIEHYLGDDNKTYRDVYLPRYAFKEDLESYKYGFWEAGVFKPDAQGVLRKNLDALAQEVFKTALSQGPPAESTTHLLDGTEDLCRFSGNIHCMTKVLRRSRAPLVESPDRDELLDEASDPSEEAPAL